MRHEQLLSPSNHCTQQQAHFNSCSEAGEPDSTGRRSLTFTVCSSERHSSRDPQRSDRLTQVGGRVSADTNMYTSSIHAHSIHAHTVYMYTSSIHAHSIHAHTVYMHTQYTCTHSIHVHKQYTCTHSIHVHTVYMHTVYMHTVYMLTVTGGVHSCMGTCPQPEGSNVMWVIRPSMENRSDPLCSSDGSSPRCSTGNLKLFSKSGFKAANEGLRFQI